MVRRSRLRRFGAGIAAVAMLACGVWTTGAVEKSRAELLAEAKLPDAVELPRPRGAVVLPDEGDAHAAISIRLGQDAPAGSLAVRRASAGDGRLYLGLRAAGGALAGTAEVSRGEKHWRAEIAGGELWLSLKPRIGKVMIRVWSPAAAAPVELVARGEHLAGIAGCRGCHHEDLTGGGGPPPGGANITPAGIGTWTKADFFRTLRTGRTPDNRQLSESMPRTLGNMPDEDLDAIWAYLKTVPAKGEKRPSQLVQAGAAQAAANAAPAAGPASGSR
jgi:mono/diheme cytochrome c family protein